MAPRRTTREPDVDPASPFAPVVEAARTMIRMLLSALPDDEHARELVKARAEGMEGIVLLCQRAGAYELDVAARDGETGAYRPDKPALLRRIASELRSRGFR